MSGAKNVKKEKAGTSFRQSKQPEAAAKVAVAPRKNGVSKVRKSDFASPVSKNGVASTDTVAPAKPAPLIVRKSHHKPCATPAPCRPIPPPPAFPTMEEPPLELRLADLAAAVDATLGLLDQLALVVATPGAADSLRSDALGHHRLAALVQQVGTRLNTAACQVGC